MLATLLEDESGAVVSYSAPIVQRGARDIEIIVAQLLVGVGRGLLGDAPRRGSRRRPRGSVSRHRKKRPRPK
jgi:hypothetical protein